MWKLGAEAFLIILGTTLWLRVWFEFGLTWGTSLPKMLTSTLGPVMAMGLPLAVLIAITFGR